MTTKQKTIVITGCSTGIGQHAAMALHQRGYYVIASVRHHSDIQPLLDAGIPRVLQLDLSDEQSVQNAIQEIHGICQGSLFALFNNGAYGLAGAVEDLSRAALARQFETNVFGTHQLTVGLLPLLQQQPDARIIQNSSVLGFVALPYRGAYVASKFALEGLTDAMRLELLNTSVKVVLIEPGPIDTQFRKNCLDVARREVDLIHSRHANQYTTMIQRLEKPGQTSKHTLGPEAVTSKLIHALESSRPRERYYVTRPTYLMGFLKRCLPSRILDRIVRHYV